MVLKALLLIAGYRGRLFYGKLAADGQIWDIAFHDRHFLILNLQPLKIEGSVLDCLPLGNTLVD